MALVTLVTHRAVYTALVTQRPSQTQAVVPKISGSSEGILGASSAWLTVQNRSREYITLSFL